MNRLVSILLILALCGCGVKFWNPQGKSKVDEEKIEYGVGGKWEWRWE